jgi:hypothetical protein
VERLDRAAHRAVHLDAELPELTSGQLLVRDDKRECRVSRRGLWELGLEAFHEVRPCIAFGVVVAANDVALPVDDRAERIHDRKDGDPRRPELAKRAALAREFPLLEPEGLSDGH